MGRTTADGFAEAVDDGQVSLYAALAYHLTANHYPPLPIALIPVAEKAIELANEIDPYETEGWDQEIELPADIEFRDGRSWITVGEAIESLHLDSFLG